MVHAIWYAPDPVPPTQPKLPPTPGSCEYLARDDNHFSQPPKSFDALLLSAAPTGSDGASVGVRNGEGNDVPPSPLTPQRAMDPDSQVPRTNIVSQKMYVTVGFALRQLRSRTYKEDQALLALHLIKRFKALQPRVHTYLGGETRLALASLMLSDQVCHDGYLPRERWAKRLNLPSKLLGAMRDQFWAGLGWSAVTRWTSSELNEWKREMQVLHTQYQLPDTEEVNQVYKRSEEVNQDYERPPEKSLALIREKSAPLPLPPAKGEEKDETKADPMVEASKKRKVWIKAWVQGVAEARLGVGTQGSALALPETSQRKDQTLARLGPKCEGKRAARAPGSAQATQPAAQVQRTTAPSRVRPAIQAQASTQPQPSLQQRCVERRGRNTVRAYRTNFTFATYTLPAPWNLVPPSEMLRWARIAASTFVPVAMTGPRPMIVGEARGFLPRNNFARRSAVDEIGGFSWTLRGR